MGSSNTMMDGDAWNALNLHTRYYTTRLHVGAFWLPAFLEEILEEADFRLTSMEIQISDTACFEITGTDHELAPRSLEYGYRFQTEKIPAGYRLLLLKEGEVAQ